MAGRGPEKAEARFEPRRLYSGSIPVRITFLLGMEAPRMEDANSRVEVVVDLWA